MQLYSFWYKNAELYTKLSTFFAVFVDNSVDYSEIFRLSHHKICARTRKNACVFNRFFDLKTRVCNISRHNNEVFGILFREVADMISFSEVRGLEVLSKSDCSIIGRIENVFFDEYFKKIAYFVTDGNNPLLIPPSEIKRIADVAVLDDTLCALKIEDIDVTAFADVMGKTVYTPFGISKGVFIDCIFDEKGKVSTIMTATAEISPAEIRGVGDVVVLKENRKPRKRKMDFSSLALENKHVSALDDTSKTSEGSAIIPQPSVNIGVGGTFTPPRIIGDYNFLLGRTLSQDLLTYSGELIAPKNTFVTIDVVEKARANGKLLDLTLNSK